MLCNSIITQVIIEIRALLLAENGYFAIITSGEVIIAVGQIFKMAASRFVDVSEEEINLMKENAIPRNTKHAAKVRNDTLQRLDVIIVLTVTKKAFKFP